MGSRRYPSLVLSNEFGSLGSNIDCGSYRGTPLGVTDYGCDKFIVVCGLFGGGLKSEGRADTRGNKDRSM